MKISILGWSVLLALSAGLIIFALFWPFIEENWPSVEERQQATRTADFMQELEHKIVEIQEYSQKSQEDPLGQERQSAAPPLDKQKSLDLDRGSLIVSDPNLDMVGSLQLLHEDIGKVNNKLEEIHDRQMMPMWLKVVALIGGLGSFVSVIGFLHTLHHDYANLTDRTDGYRKSPVDYHL